MPSLSSFPFSSVIKRTLLPTQHCATPALRTTAKEVQASKDALELSKANEAKCVEELQQWADIAPEQTNLSAAKHNQLSTSQLAHAKAKNDHLVLNESKDGKDLTTRAERKKYNKLQRANAKSEVSQQTATKAIQDASASVAKSIEESAKKITGFLRKTIDTMTKPFKAVYNAVKNFFQKIFGKEVAKEGATKTEAAGKGKKAAQTEKQPATTNTPADAKTATDKKGQQWTPLPLN